MEVTNGDGTKIHINITRLDEMKIIVEKEKVLLEELKRTPFWRIFRKQKLYKDLEYLSNHFNQINTMRINN